MHQVEPLAAERYPWFSSPKINDLQQREWRYRLIRSLRHKVRCWSLRALLWADEPRLTRAWRNGWDDDHYLRLLRLRDHGFAPKTIYDIGAHKGTWSSMCHSLFQAQASYLFEPQAQCLREIEQRRLDLNAAWQIIPVALGNQDAQLTLNVTQNRAASSLLSPKAGVGMAEVDPDAQASETVQVKRLDTLVESGHWPLPDLVKIDVQGFEKQVLEGGQRTLSQAELVVVEVSLRPIYEGQALLPEILSIFIQWGFELVDVNETYRSWPMGDLWQVDLWLRRKKGR